MIAPYRPYTLAWQAIYADEFTLEQVRRRTTMLATGLLGRGLSCLVAYDTRFMGALFARDVELTLRNLGVKATLAAAPTPLPAIHYALSQRVADCALYISACNQSYVYNGMVLIAADATDLSLDPVTEPLPTHTFPPVGELNPEQTRDLRTPYMEALRNLVDLDLVRRTSLTIFVDAMNGTTAGMFSTLLGEGGQTRAIEINREADPLFGRTTPTPVATSLMRLKKLVRESDSHLGLALSADGTAVSLIETYGEQLEPTETAMLLAAYLARHHRQRGSLLIPTPHPDSVLAGMPRLNLWEEQTGLRAESLSNPALRLNELMANERTVPLLGATNAGELIIGRYAGYPDALLAGLLCAEMVARSGGNLHTLRDAQRAQLTRVGS